MKPPIAPAHPIHPLILQRWSPRSFLDRPIDAATLSSLLEAARWAASARNEQPWRFAYAYRQDSVRFERLTRCLDPGNAWAESAAVLLLTMVKTAFSHNQSPNPHARHDLGLAMGNMTTQATSCNLNMHHMAGFSVPMIRELMHLPPDIEPVTLVAIGYLGDGTGLSEEQKSREYAPQQRKSLNELLIDVE